MPETRLGTVASIILLAAGCSPPPASPNRDGHAGGADANIAVDASLRDTRNLVSVGVPLDQLPTDDPAFHWSDARIEIGDWSFAHGAALIRFADGDRAAAASVATADRERLLFGNQPFSSRAGLSDDFVYSSNGPRAMGFFGPTWQFDAKLGARRD